MGLVDDLSGYCAVILAGGRSARLQGFDKASIEVGGRTLLQSALDAVIDASEVVVVGKQVPTERPVTFVREDPRYGGPAAALLTGRDALLRAPRRVAVLAVDMPHLSHLTFRRLTAACDGVGPGSGGGEGATQGTPEGAILVGPDGHRHLAMVLSLVALDRVRPSHEAQHDLAVHRLLAGLDLAEVPAVGPEHQDIDTWADLRDART